MKKLKKIKISGSIYKIIRKKMHHGVMGRLYISKKKICLNTNFHDGFVNGTLFHEILEAINLHYSLELPHDALTTVAEQFYVTLKDNKLLK